MKQCPKCRKLFSGADLRFCRFDGSPLNSEIIMPLDEAATILFSTGHLNKRFAALEELRHRNESGKLYE
jgi:hypothetical protein